ncbi:MAG: pyridoxamine 5'-phosphate oxidase family protein [Gemmatimonadaceae bacterium]
MANTATPVFSHLTRDEIDALLARNHVGRIAYAFHDRVDIEPINYVYADSWVYGRTSHGSKLETIAHHRWVAFEVDESSGIFDWSSVVVRGAVDFLTPESAPADAHSFEHGLTLLREFLPGTLQANDPVPFRHVVFRIHLDEVTGRQARSGQ